MGEAKQGRAQRAKNAGMSDDVLLKRIRDGVHSLKDLMQIADERKIWELYT